MAPFTNATSASGTYIVAAGQTANPLDTTSPLVLTGTLRDAAGNNAVLAIPAGQALANNKNLVIDGVIPTIASVSSTTPNGTYGTGASIDITVSFSKAVTLAGGNLTVNLNDGTSVMIAPFTNATSASGTYVIAAGQNANPLDTTGSPTCPSVGLARGRSVLAATLPLFLTSGATLRDAAGNDAVLTIPTGQSVGE